MGKSGDDMTVLVVDDDRRLLDIYTMMFRQGGVQVFSAPSGRKALEIAQEQAAEIDVILLDIIMPELDGLETLELLKKDERTKDLPVVLLTNLPEEGVLKKGQALGAADYLLKVQYKPSELIEKTRSLIKPS